jgi:GMP synthase PP-ATPase subunit
MTAVAFAFPHAFLANVATRIVNEVNDVNRAVCGVTKSL